MNNTQTPETKLYIPKQIRERYFVFPNGYFVEKKRVFEELEPPVNGELFDKIKFKIKINPNLSVYGNLVNIFEDGTVYKAVLNEIRLNTIVQIEGRQYCIISKENFPPIYGRVKLSQEKVKIKNGVGIRYWVTWLGAENPE